MVGDKFPHKHMSFLIKMPVDVEMLLKMVQKHNFIYDHSKKDFRDLEKKRLAWQEIATILNCSLDEVKTRWRTLRERFAQELRIHEFLNRNGQNQETDEIWPWFERMRFMCSHIKPRKSWEKESKPFKSGPKRKKSSEDPLQIFQESFNDSLFSPSSSYNSTSKETEEPITKRRRCPSNSSDEGITEERYKPIETIKIETTVDNDEDDLFCKVLACELRKITNTEEKQRRKAKLYLIATGLEDCK